MFTVNTLHENLEKFCKDELKRRAQNAILFSHKSYAFCLIVLF